jgi:membrane protein YqaA with SNARE-associated domain
MLTSVCFLVFLVTALFIVSHGSSYVQSVRSEVPFAGCQHHHHYSALNVRSPPFFGVILQK